MQLSTFTTLALLLGPAVANVVDADTKTSYETQCMTKKATELVHNVPTKRVTKVKNLTYQTMTGYSHSTTTITPVPKTFKNHSSQCCQDDYYP